MADQKISQLTAATTPLAGTEVLPIVQSGATVKVAVSDLTAGRAIAASAATLTGASAATSLTLANSGGGTNATFAVTENTGVTVNLNEGATKRQLIIQQGGVETWRLNASSNWAAQAGFGVAFSGNTPAAGMTSQLLNWYEEGTWTPTIASGVGTITSYNSSGYYTRIGRQVTISGTFGITNNGTGAASILISSLPFAATYGIAGGIARENTINGKTSSITASSSTTLVMFTYDNGYPGGTNAGFQFTATYFV